jgi:glutathione S-transferase
MGAGAVAGLAAATTVASDADLKSSLQEIPVSQRRKLLAALQAIDGVAASAVKVYGLPVSANCLGPVVLAMHAESGGIELVTGDNPMATLRTPEYLAMNPFHQMPFLKDGDFVIGESCACLRYTALKYKPDCYPVDNPVLCGMIDFALDSFSSEVYPKISKVFYPVLGFMAPPDDQTKVNEEATAIVDKWMSHFVNGRFVNGEKLSIADFKAVPFFFTLMQPAVAKQTGFQLSDRACQYVDDFVSMVSAAAFMNSKDGSMAAFLASKVPDAGPPREYKKADIPGAPYPGKPSGKVQVFGLPMSPNASPVCILAMDANIGGIEVCDLMKGENKTPEFTAMNPFQQIPVIKDGAFIMGESNACLRYIAIKYKPEYYPLEDTATCGMIDFAIDRFNVVSKKGIAVFLRVMMGGPAPDDQAKVNQELTEAIDEWMKHFVKGKFVVGEKLSIVDFKAVPTLFACMQPAVETKTGFKLPDAAKVYVDNFMAATSASSFLKDASGSSMKEMFAKQE